MTVTIKDVAHLAKVAPSTVSRVIADSPRISEKTKLRVREAMAELNYHPNFNARSLANKSTQALGIVMPSSANDVLQNPFFPEVIRGISTMAHNKEYALYITTGQTEEEIFEGVVRMVHGRRVDGIIVLYSRKNDRVLEYLYEQGFPFTVIGKPLDHADEIMHVDNDNFNAAYEATEYLIDAGQSRIAFVGGSSDLTVTTDRVEGYRAALVKAGLPQKEEYIVHEEFLREGGREAVSELMSLEEPPTSLVVADDLMAFGVLSRLDDMGFKVPDDVCVISFNNLMLAELSSPALTSVDIQIHILGYEACKCLIEKIDQPDTPAKRVIVPHHIVKRESCNSRP
ncbi:LacI family DNA-binding transcriptional regulator [Bacillus marinisedimentorum]|uniref:LacI family DNA-binding transcriptional regulator n=1 Tax=Bacillus marinisedimentorum TaxID=1821260 RepID=UPI00087257CA|nr:LacI family DNA-binding transcriptional regulator [Bacillus marinisedimentorum]